MACSNLNLGSGNNFQLYFPVLPFSSTIQDSKDLSIHVYGSIIPGVNFDSTPHSWQGWDMKRLDSNLIFQDLTIEFSVTEDFRNWLVLFEWMTNINNNKDIASKGVNTYTTDANLIVYDNFGKSIFKLKYINIVPYDLSAVTLSYRDAEMYLESTCTFAYDRFELDI